MPTSKAKLDITGYILVVLTTSFFLFILITSTPQIPEPTAQIAITGTAALNIIPACSLDLKQGWNFVSFCANQSNTNITSMLGPVNQSIRFVLEWNTSTQSFIIYTPRAASPAFTEFNLSKSYFIYYTDTTNASITLNGPSFTNVNISLQQGWETPNYPYAFTSNVSQYLDTIAGKYLFLQKWNYTPQEFIIYSALASENPFYQISSGEGQFLLITDPGGADLFYNKTRLENG
jgi:hypothetical protein